MAVLRHVRFPPDNVPDEPRNGLLRLADEVVREVERSINARQWLAEVPDDVVLFTGRNMCSAEHSRSERALHRWDIIGRDDVGWAMLAQPELTLHSLKILTEMPVLAETLANRLHTAKYDSGEELAQGAALPVAMAGLLLAGYVLYRRRRLDRRTSP